jgi:hypothetical protein
MRASMNLCPTCVEILSRAEREDERAVPRAR